MGEGWIGVDLDGTLAYYDEYRGPSHIGEPIELMVKHVKDMLDQGFRVKIFTARVCAQNGPEAIELSRIAIESWCKEHLGVKLEVTNIKDYAMIELYDDRAYNVVKNKGLIIAK
jgi:hypothetical protein